MNVIIETGFCFSDVVENILNKLLHFERAVNKSFVSVSLNRAAPPFLFFSFIMENTVYTRKI